VKCVILQPSYIPWRGYFHQIQKADVFVFYDDVQYDAHGWRNRNRIKTPSETRWLTIPVRLRDHCTDHTPIHAVETCVSAGWHRKHLSTLRQNYRKAPYFSRYVPLLESWYSEPSRYLADFTIRQTIDIASVLGISKTRFIRSSSLGIEGVKTERLIKILRHLGATHYISGPAAGSYLDEPALASAGIQLEYMQYDYPVYPQLYGTFDSRVSILDLLFTTGPEAAMYIWDSMRTPSPGVSAQSFGSGGTLEPARPL
jgi:hypothetical protein